MRKKTRVCIERKAVRINPTGSPTNFEEWIAPESASVARTLRPSAVFRAGTDRDGYLTIDSSDILYPRDTPFVEVETRYCRIRTGPRPEYTAIYGSVYAAEAGGVRIVVPSNGRFLEAGDTIDIASEESFTITSADFSNAKVYRYDTDSR